MSVSSINAAPELHGGCNGSDASAGPVPRRSVSLRVSKETAIRLVLVAVAVAVCHAFDWMYVRQRTLEFNSWLDSLVGVNLVRISADTVTWNGGTFRYVVSCTFADVFCGAIPLVWSLRRSILANVAFIAAMAVVLFVYNGLRLSASDFLFARGLSWDLAHNVFSGVSYYFVWLAIVSRPMARWVHPERS